MLGSHAIKQGNFPEEMSRSENTNSEKLQNAVNQREFLIRSLTLKPQQDVNRRGENQTAKL